MATSPSSRSAAIVVRRTLFLFILLTALALLGLNPQRASAATTRYVSSTGTGDGTTWAKASNNLQGIINAAHAGDQVWVKYAQSSYVGNFMAIDGVAVYGHFAGTETSISQRKLTSAVYKTTLALPDGGSGTVYTIPSTATGTNMLDGFTVQNGTSRGINDPSGDKLVVANCTIYNNSSTGGDGGGLYTQGVTATLINCFFNSNNANANYETDIHGGGLYTAATTAVTISNCYFTGNNANSNYSTSFGGGVFTDGKASINGSTFNSNHADNTQGAVFGSGGDGSSLTVDTCTFTGNTGGGIAANSAANTIKNCTFNNNNGRGVTVGGTNTSSISNCTFNTNNVTGDNGGALYAGSASTTVSNCLFMGNKVYANYEQNVYGGALYTEVGTTVAIDGCTFTGNSEVPNYSTAYGGGVGGFGTPSITHCSFIGDSPDEIDLEDVGDPIFGSALIADSLFYGTGTGAGNGINLGIRGGSTPAGYVVVSNNTIVNTNAALNIGTGPDTGGDVVVANNIFYKNNGGVNYNATVTFNSSHNDLNDNITYKYQGVVTTTSDLTSSPAFVSTSPTSPSFLILSSASLLIDAGDDDYIVDSTDLAGNPRKQGRAVDIGCYETPINSAARLSSLSPSSTQAGHNSFTITVNGSGFLSGTNAAKVVFGSTLLTTTFVSSTKLTATVPASLVAAAGTMAVYVNNQGMGSSASLPFNVSAASTLTSLSPASKPAGSAAFTLTASGTGFVSGAVVYFNGTALTTTYSSSTKLTAAVPASLVAAQGATTVTVANPATSMDAPLTFMLTTPIATLTKLSPAAVQVGSDGFTLTLTGTYFVPGAVVKWNGTTLTSAEFSSTAMAAQVPSSLLTTAGTASVTVTNPGVAASNALTFTITPLPAPAHLSSLSPSAAKAGSAGFTLTLTGTGFVNGAAVKWGNTVLSSAFFSSTTMVALVPSSLLTTAGTASVTVVNPGVAASNAQTFTITH